MKKLFLVLSVMILALSPVYAQDDTTADTAATETTETTAETTTANQEATGTNTVSEITPFGPSFTDLRNTDDVALDKEYNLLQTNLTKMREDYLFRVLYKANKILERYTNVNFTDTNEMFYNAVYYYDLVANPLANDNNIDIALHELDKSFKLYDDIKPIYEILGKTNELKQADYELNLYAGILNLFKGTAGYYAKSRFHLMNALNNELSGENDAQKLIMLNTYLAGVNYNLATINQNSDVSKVYFLNEMFNNLWDLTTLKTADENIKTAKYKLLITKYHKVLYTTSERFRTTYAKYYDELGFVYGQTESEVLSREKMPVYRDYENEAAAPGTTTDTTATTETETTDAAN
ncbi:hypothetical protein [Brachyspira hyodysenteriae]|uniref:hypothetical protein n=1 Tax=Brachyspira hyodysenteriae TaxID=159 RepID=UPI00063D9AF7|nr:hypothetical protein [Brachyspira hyodysenteriae]KLI43053.1 hypothetical protein SZ53_04980 [Brachyspira hyodysenteriae]TVL66848.1 hypothetical protein A9X85_05840 [Brachyspira hyodysenteriae]TVL75047.1 hypothetical protein A9X79_00795 [Brachyspira hyodysenteriae]